MSFKIGIIGDPHAAPGPLADALDILKKQQVDDVWCTGDVAGYGTELNESVRLLKEAGCRTVCGNHEQWYLERGDGQGDSAVFDYLQGLPVFMDANIEGRRIYMVHASPPESMMKGIRLLDEEGSKLTEEKRFWSDRLKNITCDVLIVGHTHQVFAEQLGTALVVNPGSTRFNHCCGILNLPDMKIEWIPLPGKRIQYTWNWGNEQGRV